MSRGASLLETIIACFFLTSLVLVTTQLFHSSLAYGTRIERRVAAAMLAHGELEKLRQWARQGTNFEDWSSWDGRSQQFEQYTLRTEVEPHRLSSPSTGLEQGYAPPRALDSTVVQVEVTASWGAGPLDQVRLVALVGEPPRGLREPDALEVSPVGSVGALNPGQEVEFEARLFDRQGRIIEDALFVWYVRPLDGNATVLPDRDGRRTRVKNQVEKSDGTLVFTGGQCEVVARAVYYGEERRASWGPITLVP